MPEYTTKNGDTWDMIALSEYGSEAKADKLMQANDQYIETAVFGAGIVLEVPELEEAALDTLPPWKRG